MGLALRVKVRVLSLVSSGEARAVSRFRVLGSAQFEVDEVTVQSTVPIYRNLVGIYSCATLC